MQIHPIGTLSVTPELQTRFRGEIDISYLLTDERNGNILKSFLQALDARDGPVTGSGQQPGGTAANSQQRR